MDSLSAVEQARAAVRASATFGYLPEPQRALAAPAPPAGTIEIVTRASALDYSDSWSGFKLTRAADLDPAARVSGRGRFADRLPQFGGVPGLSHPRLSFEDPHPQRPT